MGQPINQEGTFQGRIVSYGLQESKEGSAVAVFVRAQLDNVWNAEQGQWEDWKEYGLEAEGYLYVIKKDGTTNKNQVESLVQAAGWDGSFKSIVEGTWKPTPCSFTIQTNQYKGNTTYRIGFVNEYAREPGGGGNVTPDRARELEAKYGATLRAISGSAARNSTKPANGKPPSPPKREAAPAAAAATPAGGDDIPF